MTDNSDYIEKLKIRISNTERKLALLNKELSDLTMNTTIARYKRLCSKYQCDEKVIPFIKSLDRISSINIGRSYINFADNNNNDLFSAEKITYGDDIEVRYRYCALSKEESYGMDCIKSWFDLCDILDPYTDLECVDELCNEED
jgi:hypothetical protein